jgi:hypothetical protein
LSRYGGLQPIAGFYRKPLKARCFLLSYPGI